MRDLICTVSTERDVEKNLISSKSDSDLTKKWQTRVGAVQLWERRMTKDKIRTVK